MTLKLTAVLTDVLNQSVDKPEPITLPLGAGSLPIQPLMFPADWSSQVVLETRWQTDITASKTMGTTERTSLSSRPSRSLTVTVTGRNREESHAIVQSCMSLTQRFGSPVPIASDGVAVTAVVPLGIGDARIYGDFRFGRFFEGGRVCFISASQVFVAAAEQGAALATITEIASGEMRISYNPLAFRAVGLSDTVFPCMDVELVASTSGVSLTDSIYQVDLNWNEVDGANALPGLWPAIGPTNADVLRPLCQIVDNVPVFPLDINWADGVTINTSREISTDKAGRSAVQETSGFSYHTFSISVMGKDRPTGWKILRFFDAMRGRAGAFWFVNPQAPWTLLSFPSLTQVIIKATGRSQEINSFYRTLAFFRADGTIVRRTVASVTDFGDAFQIGLSSALPDTDFVSLQPMHFCTFNRDSVKEVWVTDAVMPSVDLEIVEQQNPGPVSLVASLGYVEGFPSLFSVPDCTFLVKAGGAAVAADGRTCMTWPGRGSTPQRLIDFSKGTPRTSAKWQPIKWLERNGQATSTQIRFNNRRSNNGQPTVFNPSYLMPHMLDSALPMLERHLWSQAGWTLFMCFTPFTFLPTATDRELFLVHGINSKVRFLVDVAGQSGVNRTQLQLDFSPGGIAGWTGFPLSIALNGGDTPRCLTLRFDSGTPRIHAWVDGVKAFSAALAYPLPQPIDYAFSKWWEGFNYGAGPTAAVINSWFGAQGCANLMASYNRPLSTSEIDSIHTVISGLYKSPMIPVSLYA